MRSQKKKRTASFHGSQKETNCLPETSSSLCTQAKLNASKKMGFSQGRKTAKKKKRNEQKKMQEQSGRRAAVAVSPAWKSQSCRLPGSGCKQRKHRTYAALPRDALLRPPPPHGHVTPRSPVLRNGPSFFTGIGLPALLRRAPPLRPAARRSSMVVCIPFHHLGAAKIKHCEVKLLSFCPVAS